MESFYRIYEGVLIKKDHETEERFKKYYLGSHWHIRGESLGDLVGELTERTALEEAASSTIDITREGEGRFVVTITLAKTLKDEAVSGELHKQWSNNEIDLDTWIYKFYIDRD